ncbi:Galanin peptide, partial [Varanus komodoensis]
MHRCTGLLLVCLIFCAALSETFGLVLSFLRLTLPNVIVFSSESSLLMISPKYDSLSFVIFASKQISKNANMLPCPAGKEQAKEKRGWTMNSAGYLLGPRRIEQLFKEMPSERGREELPGEYAIDRVFSDKHGLAGKRDTHPEENLKAGTFGRPWTDDNIMRTVIEFLTYLRLKEAGMLDNISTTTSSEETD